MPTSQTRPVSAGPSSRGVEVTDGIGANEWNEFVRQHPQATGYHLWEWRDVFQSALGHKTHYLAAREGGRVTGVLPLTEVRSRLFGRALSSSPYVNYGGVLATNDTAARELVDCAAALARDRSLEFVLLRHRNRVFSDFPSRTHKVTMLLPLSSSAEAMWTALDRKVRNQVRKAEKSALTTVAGGSELVDDFYSVFAQNMRDLGTPVYGRELFAAIVSAFPADARIHLVKLAGQTIAGALSYGFRETIEVPSASSLREHRALCPNHLMYWSIISDAIAQGRTVFDFGRSTPDDGTYHFKEQWGARPEPLCWEYVLTGGSDVPQDDRHSAKYQAFIEVWKRLPLGIASIIGPRIARAVP
jgi:FemAB-related protein (PEP-CTERM system-associated)